MAPALLWSFAVVSRLRLLFLLPCLYGGLGLAAPRSPRTDPTFEGYKRGGLSEVYVDRSTQRVVKLIGSRALPRSQWIDYPRWLVRTGGRVSPDVKRHLTAQSMSAYQRLRDDPRFSARYGRLLPATSSPAPGRIDQAFVEGLDFDALGPQARLRAGAQMRQILSLAGDVLKGETVDHNRYNFVFDRAGAVVAWVDWVIARVPERLQEPR